MKLPSSKRALGISNEVWKPFVKSFGECTVIFNICLFIYLLNIYFRLNASRTKTAVQINSAANSDFSANSAWMVLDVSAMTSVVAKKFANLEIVKLSQVR